MEGCGSEVVKMEAFLEVWIVEVSAEICLDAVICYNCGRFRPIGDKN